MSRGKAIKAIKIVLGLSVLTVVVGFGIVIVVTSITGDSIEISEIIRGKDILALAGINVISIVAVLCSVEASNRESERIIIEKDKLRKELEEESKREAAELAEKIKADGVSTGKAGGSSKDIRKLKLREESTAKRLAEVYKKSKGE